MLPAAFVFCFGGKFVFGGRAFACTAGFFPRFGGSSVARPGGRDDASIVPYKSFAMFAAIGQGQHRTIPALRLKHRSGSCGTASALPKCSIRHPVLSALLAWHLPHLARRIGTLNYAVLPKVSPRRGEGTPLYCAQTSSLLLMRPSGTPPPTSNLLVHHNFSTCNGARFRRGRVTPPYRMFYVLSPTIKCSVGNGLDRSGTMR